MNLLILLQTVEPVVEVADQVVQTAPEESYLSLVMKGGWILLPIFLLSLLAIYVIINKWLIINRLGEKRFCLAVKGD